MSLIVKHLSKSYGKTPVLKDVSFEVKNGEFFSVLGKSGSGKTTLLRILAGLESADSGSITLNGQNIGGTPAHQRKIPLVFQNYALFPHLSVYENVAFGLREQKISNEGILRIVLETLKLLSIDDKMYRSPSELSGGEQQRVAIARALAVSSPITLFDEPLSNLDAELRRTMQKELKQIQQKMSRTFVYITHDQEEALTLSDKLMILDKGLVCELDTPEEVYHHPKSLFGAGFLGTSNLIKLQKLDRHLFKTDSGLVISNDVEMEGKFFIAVIRPEHLVAVDLPGTNTYKAKIISRYFKGAHFDYQLEIEGTTLSMISTKALPDHPLISIKTFFLFPL